MPHNVLEQQERPRQDSNTTIAVPPNKQAQHSIYAKTALMSRLQNAGSSTVDNVSQEVLPPPAITSSGVGAGPGADGAGEVKPRARFAKDVVGAAAGAGAGAGAIARDGVGHALSDTPLPSLPSSPRL